MVERFANLTLRGADGRLRVRVRWPAAGDRPGLVVLVADAERVAEIFTRAGAIVLVASCVTLGDAAAALEWAADHAGELGADPRWLMVAGGAVAAALALHARDQGWPSLARQVLIGPDLAGAASSLAGVAPAIVLDDRRYAVRLREAGVEVEEPRDEDDFVDAVRRALPHRHRSPEDQGATSGSSPMQPKTRRRTVGA